MIKIDKAVFFMSIAVIVSMFLAAGVFIWSQDLLLKKALHSDRELRSEIVVLKWALDDCEKRPLKK
jgi:hypothetical protein